jgi:UDP-N-acetylglucosamine:LPS N-acetylglucosamine transferase
MFLNFSNHASNFWSIMQLEKAKEMGGVVEDIQFPKISGKASFEDVEKIALEISKIILELKPDVVMCQGEFSLTYMVINILRKHDIRTVCACTERVVVEHFVGDKVEKYSEFVFKGFRDYYCNM